MSKNDKETYEKKERKLQNILTAVYLIYCRISNMNKGCLQKIKKVNFGTSAQKGGGGIGKIQNSHQ